MQSALIILPWLWIWCDQRLQAGSLWLFHHGGHINLLSIAVIKHLDEKQLEDEVCLPYNAPHSLSVLKGRQGRNLEAGPGTKFVENAAY